MDALAARLVELRDELGRTVAVGISGIDCAGKSTLAESLRARLERLSVPTLVICGDEFTRPTAERYSEPDEGLSYYRDSFDYGFLSDEFLPAVRAGSAGEFSCDVSDWENDSWRRASFVVPPSGVVLVEGCFLLTRSRSAAFDFRIWIDLPLDGAIVRALNRPRDLERMGGASGVRARYERRYLPGQKLHIELDGPRERADVVLSPQETIES